MTSRRWVMGKREGGREERRVRESGAAKREDVRTDVRTDERKKYEVFCAN